VTSLQAVLFDLDGTLMDTPLAIADVVRRVLAAQGHPAAPPERITALVGVSLAPLFADLLGVDSTSPQVHEAITEYRRLYERDVTARAHELVYPGVPEGLAQLRAVGLKLAVATNKIESVAVAMLDVGGLLPFFDVVVGADMVEAPKPDPAMAHHAARLLGVPVTSCVMVGDTTHDVRMARAAGMPVIALTHGAHDHATLTAAGAGVVVPTFPDAVADVTARAGRRAAR